MKASRFRLAFTLAVVWVGCRLKPGHWRPNARDQMNEALRAAAISVKATLNGRRETRVQSS